MLQSNEEKIKFVLNRMEKEILYYKGSKRLRAKKAYYKLLESCGSSCELDQPIYIARNE